MLCPQGVHTPVMIERARKELIPKELHCARPQSWQSALPSLLGDFCRSAVQEVDSQKHECNYGKHEQAGLRPQLASGEPVAAVKRCRQQAIGGEPPAVWSGVNEIAPKSNAAWNPMANRKSPVRRSVRQISRASRPVEAQ